MRFGTVAFSVLIMGCSAGVSAESSASARAFSYTQTLYKNLRAYTLDPSHAWATRMLVRDGKIVAIDPPAETRYGAETRVVDLGGRFVLPGFHDAHTHPIDSGVDLLECPVYAYKTLSDVIARVKSCNLKMKDRPLSEWLRGSGWTQFLFPTGAPHRTTLDRITTKRPIYLMSGDGHSVWLNSRALALAQIDRNTKDPRDGKIVRDRDGTPTGVLMEGAMALVDAIMPERSMDLRIRGLKNAITLAHQYGITSFHDAYLTREHLEVYREMEKQGFLSVEMSGALYADSNLPVEQVEDLFKLKQEFETDQIRLKTVKIFMDGVIEDKTAALLEPYLNPGAPPSSDRGEIQWDLNRLHEVARRAVVLGFNLHFHAIGDRAVREALNTIEDAEVISGVNVVGHRISHLQLVHPDDWKRFAKLGIFADFQPLWACRDVAIRQYTEPYIGPVRSKYLYPIGGVLNAGGEMAFGSDWSVTSMNPLSAIQTAITRMDPNGVTDSNWTPEHRIGLEAAIRGYTLGGARAEQREKDFGSLEVGKFANFVVLDHDLFRIPVREISRTKVLSTYRRGQLLYQAR